MLRQYTNTNTLEPINITNNSSKNLKIVDSLCKIYGVVFIPNDGRSGANNYTFGIYKFHSEFDKKNIIDTLKNENKYNNVYFEELNSIMHRVYNFDKQAISEPIHIVFDYDNSILSINDKNYKVVEDANHEFTFKLQKTQIKAIDGLKGLSKFIVENCHYDGVFNMIIADFFKNIENNVKEFRK